MGRRTILLLRTSVFVIACTFLYLRFASQPEVWDAELLSARWTRPGTLFPLLLVALMMLLNWGVEALKWKQLVGGLETVSFPKAYVATIAGTSIGMITPNRVGEFVGRVLYLAPENRIPGSFATTVGSIAQFVTTVVMGTVGLAVLFATGSITDDPWRWSLPSVCGLVGLASLVLYFHPAVLHTVVGKVPVLRRWADQAAILGSLSFRRLLHILALSSLRYCIFTLQFILLLDLFAQVPWQLASVAAPAAFLVGSLIPTVMLTELGVRGSIAVALISTGPTQDQGVLLASSCLWLINVAFPALVGSVLLLVTRIRSGKE